MCLLTGSVDSCKNSNCSSHRSPAQCVPTLSGHVCRCRQNPDLNFFNLTSGRCEGEYLINVFIFCYNSTRIRVLSNFYFFVKTIVPRSYVECLPMTVIFLQYLNRFRRMCGGRLL